MKRRNFLTAIVLGAILFFGGAHANTPTGPEIPKKSQAFTLDLKINNPLKVENIQDAIKLGLNFVMKIAIPVIIVLLIWAGFQFIFAMGNKDKLIKAKNNFLYTLFGAALVLGAYTIAIAIINTINSLTQ
jgi:hypothetical protein